MRPCFKLFSAVPNRFNLCQNVSFTVLVLKSNRKYVYVNVFCFQNVICSYKSFQIVSEWIIYRSCLLNFLYTYLFLMKVVTIKQQHI